MLSDKARRQKCQEIARRIKGERERKGLTMTDLGKLCGLSQQSISYIERGKRIPNLDTLLLIADALGTKLSALAANAGC